VKPSPSYQSSLSQTTQSPHPQKRPVGPLVYIIRLLILGIGIGALAGTLLSALNPATQASVKRQETAKKQVQASATPANPSPSLQLTPEIPGLKAQIQALATPYPTLTPGVFIIDLDTGAYMDLEGHTSFASASTIKLPILIAFFQDVDAGKVRLDERLTLKAGMIADGSGDLQYKQAGTKYTALEVATKMIVISDNTATNMLIDRLGGAQALNQRFRSWGLTTTVIRNRLPDIEGTNTTSPKELANLISVVQQGNLVSSESRDRLLNIMQRNEINTLLPQGLGSGASIAHKTGNIGSLLADVGLVEMPTGKRYVIAVMVKRPFNDASAEELIRKISRKTYDYFNQPRATPSTNSMPLKSVRSIT
jgi:beta-lactamase class A